MDYMRVSGRIQCVPHQHDDSDHDDDDGHDDDSNYDEALRWLQITIIWLERYWL